MDKKIIVRYIEGNVSDLERKEMIAWIGQSSQNKEYFNLLYNLSALHAENPELKPDYKSLRLRLGSKRVWLDRVQRIAAFLVIPLLLAVVLLWISKEDNRSLQFTDNSLEMSTFAGVKGKVTLPDGSTVWLNSNSTLKYPRQFAKKVRNVFLTGEAYFEVVKNPQRPMVVSTKSGVKVTVHGTKFNLSSYDNDATVTAALLEGSISVTGLINGNLKSKPIEMKPNDIVVIRKEKKAATFEKSKPIGNYKAWKEGTLIFDDASMLEVQKMLERWHGVEIEIADTSLNNYHFTAKFSSESVVQIMELLKKTSPITYQIKDNKVIIAKK